METPSTTGITDRQVLDFLAEKAAEAQIPNLTLTAIYNREMWPSGNFLAYTGASQASAGITIRDAINRHREYLRQQHQSQIEAARKLLNSVAGQHG